MATEDAEVNDKSDINSHSVHPTDSDNMEQSDDLKGWLMKRTKISHKWKKTFFHLKDTNLLYGNSEEKLQKKISLQTAEISECAIDNKDHAFRVKPKDTKRVFYMYAPDAQTENMWMQAICFAKATGKSGDNLDMEEVSDTDDNFDHHIGLSPHSSDSELQSPVDNKNFETINTLDNNDSVNQKKQRNNKSQSQQRINHKSADDKLVHQEIKTKLNNGDEMMTTQMSQLQELVCEMKEGFLTAMQALAQIQHGDQVLQEKVDSNKVQYENQLADVLKMVVNLKGEFSGVLSQLQTATSNQRSLQSQVETLRYERDVLLEELSKAGSISSQVRDKYQSGISKSSKLSHCTSLTALLERSSHSATMQHPDGSNNSIHITSDHDSGVNSAAPGDSCDDSPSSNVSPLVQSYIANLSQTPAPVPEEDGSYESDCSIAAAANHSLDLSRSLIDELDDLVGSDEEKEADAVSESTEQIMSGEKSVVPEFKNPETPKKIAPHERSAKDFNRLRIARELLDTEKKYCSCLWTLLDHFAGQLKEKSILSISDISEMFPPCLARMYDYHCALLQALEQRLTSCKYQFIIGDILFRFIQDSQCELLNQYQTYMKEFPRAMHTIKQMALSHPQFRKFLRDAQKDPCCEGLDVGAFLLTPVQRMPRYVLLLKQMLRYTEVDHPDHYYIETSLRHLGTFLNTLNDSIQHSLHQVSNHKNKPKRRFSILPSFRQTSTASVNSIHSETSHRTKHGMSYQNTQPRPSAETIYGQGNYSQNGVPVCYSTESFALNDDVSLVQDGTGRLIPVRPKKFKGKRVKKENRNGGGSLVHSASFHSSQSESNFGTEISYPNQNSHPLYSRTLSAGDDVFSDSSFYSTVPVNGENGSKSHYYAGNKGKSLFPKPPPQFANETSTPNLHGLKSQSAVHFGIYGENDSDLDADISSSTNAASLHSPRYPHGRGLRNHRHGLKSQSCIDMSEQQENMLQERINIALARSLTFKDGGGPISSSSQVDHTRVQEYDASWAEESQNYPPGSLQRPVVVRAHPLSGNEQHWTFMEPPTPSSGRLQEQRSNRYHQNMVQGVSRKEGKKKRSKHLQSQSETDLFDQSARRKKTSLKQSIKNIFFRKRLGSDYSDELTVHNGPVHESSKVIQLSPAINRPNGRPETYANHSVVSGHPNESINHTVTYSGERTINYNNDSVVGGPMNSTMQNKDSKTMNSLMADSSTLNSQEMSQIEEQVESVTMYAEESGEPCSAV